MREQATRLKIRRLYILGAGASYDASQKGEFSSPLDKDLLENIRNIDLEKPFWINEFKGSLEGTYKGSGSLWSTGMETAVIRQLSQLQFLQTFHPKRARDNVNPIEWLDKLNALACTRLQKARGRAGGPYKLLAESVKNFNDSSKHKKDRIITFNYDTLLDKEFLESTAPQDLYFAKIRTGKSDEASTSSNPFPILLKLHGSTNWRCDTSDLHKSISVTDREDTHYIERIWTDGSRPDPEGDSRPLMVPPLPNKPITSVSILKYLWRKAYEYLYEAEHICIAGYSLPATDTLAKAMFASFTSTDIKSIHIADPDGGMINRWRETLGRTGSRINEWRYSPSFTDMIDRECS